jgi:hypothetical protein
LPLRGQFLLLFVLGFASRTGLVVLTHQYRDTTRYELQREAYSLATTGTLGNPYAIETGPSAHVSPGYPIILAGIYCMFGAGERGEMVKEIAASTVSAAGWAMLPVAASALSLTAVVGFLAGFVGALLPLKLSVETKGDWEAPYTALAVMLIACMSASLWRQKRFTISHALRSGAAWGISLLFVSALLPVLLTFAVAGFFRAPFSRYGRFLAVQLTVVALLLLPWILRNQRALGSPISTRSNFGLELRLSNNDLAGPLERDNYERGVYHVYHPLQNVKEAERLRALGEPAFNREATQEALDWTFHHPARFATLTAQRIFYFWFQPVPGQTGKAVILGVEAILGLLGLGLFLRANFWSALPLALFVLVLPLPNYLVHVGLRHRFGLDWICLLLSVYSVSFLLGKTKNGQPNSITPLPQTVCRPTPVQ